MNEPTYTCPNCDIPQGNDYLVNLPPRRITVTSNGAPLAVDLCSHCFDKLEKMTPAAREKRLGVIHRRAKGNPEEYRVREDAEVIA